MPSQTDDGRFVSPCCQCGTAMWLPLDLFAAAKHSEKIIFYCAYGHAQVFPQGDSELVLVRRERDRLTQRLAMKDDQIKDALKERNDALKAASEAEKKRTNLTRRISAGVCPCCHRSFKQLANHMKYKHPEEYGKVMQ